MKNYLSYSMSLIVLLLLTCTNLTSLKRDCYNSYCCIQHSYSLWDKPNLFDLTQVFPIQYVSLIPPYENSTCSMGGCGKPSHYFGYSGGDYRRYLPHFLEYLNYCNLHRECTCYWPEVSTEAAEISDTACLLFEDLISQTALYNILFEREEQLVFLTFHITHLSLNELACAFIAQQLRFSDYYNVCCDIENYARFKYDDREAAMIKDKLEDILEALYPKFLSLYTTCLAKHRNSQIEQELSFMRHLAGNISVFDKTESNLCSKNYKIIAKTFDRISREALLPKGKKSKHKKKKRSSRSKIFIENPAPCPIEIPIEPKINSIALSSTQSETLLAQGSIYNDLYLYEDSIGILTQAIQLDSTNRNCYIERATAYFETNQLSLALQDYERAKELTKAPPFLCYTPKSMQFIPNNSLEFSSGLIWGTLEGAKESVVDFIPSVLGCCRGIYHGLWAFACSPREVSVEMLNAAYGIGEYICSHSTSESLAVVIPEIRELSQTWSSLDEYSRGKKIGYIIGKYGIEIFGPAGVLKYASKIRTLKRANTLCTLEICAASHANRATIMEETAKWSAKRETLIKAARNGKILIKNENAQYHIMQEKHAWQKVINLTEDTGKDFKKVVVLLEENKIMDKKFLVGDPEFFPKDKPKIIRFEHKMVINNEEVKAVFETYIETGEIYLQNAWVVTE